MNPYFLLVSLLHHRRIRVCPVCHRSQRVPAVKKTKSVRCRYCGSMIVRPSRHPSPRRTFGHGRM